MTSTSFATRRAMIGLVGAGIASALTPTAQAAAFDAVDIVSAVRRELAGVGGHARYRDRVGIVDFGQPSHLPRLHLFDVEAGHVESLLVAHGRGSDPDHTGWVRKFSNTEGSNASSEGAYLTSDYYVGKHGRSMRLQGLESSNCNAASREIVVHAAPYVDPSLAERRGMIGRSLGCFAVAPEKLEQVLDRLGPGRLLIARKFSASPGFST